jgi:hypothetical protein
MQYIHFQLHAQRKWLPVWYYVKQANYDVDTIVDDLRRQVATYPASRDALVQRLLRKVTSYKEHPGNSAKMRASILKGNIELPKNETDDTLFANALQGLPTGYAGASTLKPLLLPSLDRTQGNDGKSSNRRSTIYRAACRLDELLYG